MQDRHQSIVPPCARRPCPRAPLARPAGTHFLDRVRTWPSGTTSLVCGFMPVGLSIGAFVLGAAASLATSWVLVVRLERVGGRLGLSEALLGMVAALAADAPEITASVTALSHHQETIGAGVVIGSNVFNLAALLGLGAVVAGRIGLHRRVVLLGGAIAVTVSVVCFLCVAVCSLPTWLSQCPSWS